VVYHFTNSPTVIPGTPFRRAPRPGARYRPFEPAEDPYRTAARAQIQSTTQSPDTIHYAVKRGHGRLAQQATLPPLAPEHRHSRRRKRSEIGPPSVTGRGFRSSYPDFTSGVFQRLLGDARALPSEPQLHVRRHHHRTPIIQNTRSYNHFSDVRRSERMAGDASLSRVMWRIN